MTIQEKERLAVVEQRVTDLIGRVDERFDDLSGDICSLKDTIDKQILQADKRYAAKWSERVVGGMVTLMVTAVLAALINLVIKNN